MVKIYLAGAMQIYGEESEKARKWRNEVKEYFSNYCLGFECISPVDFYEYGSNCSQSEREAMRFDLRKVKEADVILVNLNDVRKSLGTSDEILYAYVEGKPIIGFITEDVDNVVNYVHPWKFEQLDRIETGENSMIRACDYIRNYYY